MTIDHAGVSDWRPSDELDLQRRRRADAESLCPAEAIDLDIALNKFHQLGLEDGDLGYACWYKVGELLKKAHQLQATNTRLLKRYGSKREDIIRECAEVCRRYADSYIGVTNEGTIRQQAGNYLESCILSLLNESTEGTNG